MHKRVSSSLLAAGLLIGAVLAPPAFADISAATSAGQAAGGYGARDFNPQRAFEQTRRNMGMISADPSGRIGDEASVRVRQEQDRPFQCRDGAMATGGQLRIRVDECERNADGSLQSLSVSVCDAMMSGAPCHDHSFSPSRDIPTNATNEFSGGSLMGRYVIGAECDTDGCSMNVWQEHGELFEMDPWEMREQARERNRRLGDDSPAALVQGIREHDSYEFVDSRSSPTAQPSGWMGERAHCLGGQFNQLFTQGDIPVTCDPDDPRSIVFLDPNGDGACTAEEIREERCVVDIPTHLTTCEPDQRECQVERPAEEFICERRREVTVVGTELDCENRDFLCRPDAQSCCNVRIRCNSNGSANIRYRDCCGHEQNFTASSIEAFLGGGQRYNWHPASVLRCQDNGQCYMDFQNYLCSNPSRPRGELDRAVRSFTLGTRNIYEDLWVDECSALESRIPQD